MRDPKLIDHSEKRICDDWRRKYLQRSLDLLPADVVELFDRNWRTDRAKDAIQAELLATQADLRFANWKIWALMIIVTGEGCVIGWVLKAFLAAHIK